MLFNGSQTETVQINPQMWKCKDTYNRFGTIKSIQMGFFNTVKRKKHTYIRLEKKRFLGDESRKG